LLDLGVDEGRARAHGRTGTADRIEREHDAFFERVRAAYRARAAAEPGRIRVLDATRPAEVVAADAVAQLQAFRGAMP
jgi:dTMP kinase